jgi:molecular chaperone DnaK
MEFKEGHTVGIDLGTTFSSIAHLDAEGRPVPVPNEDDDVETPSLILLTDSRHVIVGPSRERASEEDPQHIVERIKRHMGDVEFKRTFDGEEITPEFLSALILKKLRQDAEKRIGRIGNAVITVPYYFNDQRRKATQDAGRISGLNVIDIINEPTAATLAYAWLRGELGGGGGHKTRHAMVYDLGGGTFDVTLVRYTPTHFQVLGTDGDVELGGVDWNDRILNYVADEYQAKHGVDVRNSPAAINRLRFLSDRAKIELSKNLETRIVFRHDGKAVTVVLTREKFEDLTQDLLQRTIDTTELVMEQAKLAPGQLDALVLVGGSTLMPKVAQRLEQAVGVRPYMELNPHTAVAQGAAIHAAILEAKYRKAGEMADKVRRHLSGIKQDNVNSHGLGVAVRDASGKLINHVMIPRNSRLPAEKQQVFYTNTAGQSRVSVKVYEGEAPDPDACAMVGTCRITGLPPNLPQGSPIAVTYSFDDQGRVRVRAKDQTGGTEATIDIERRSGLSESQVDTYTRLAEQYKVE